MKKYSLLKAIIITFLIFIGLTWLIKSGSYDGKTFTLGDLAPMGIISILRAPVITISTLSHYIFVFLSIGILYGVLNKTGAYTKLVTTMKTKCQSVNSELFLILTMVGFALLSSLTGLPLVILTLVPFFLALLLSLKYDKVTAFAVTIGSILVGCMVPIYGNAEIGKYYFNIGANTEILTKIILFAMLTFLFVLAVLKYAKNHKQEEKVEIPLYENETDKKKSFVPIIIIVSLLTVIGLLGIFPWETALGFKGFATFLEKVTSFTVKDIPIFSYILGDAYAFGTWSYIHFSTLLLIGTFAIKWIYSIKLDDFFDGIKKGVSQMITPAIYATLSGIIFATIYYSSGAVVYTIIDFLLGLVKGFNIVIMSLVGLTGSFFFGEFGYLINPIYGLLATFDAAIQPLIIILLQAMFGIVSLILPVSFLLISGLRYLNISYKDWLKFIWRYLLEAFVIIMVVCIIVMNFAK